MIVLKFLVISTAFIVLQFLIICAVSFSVVIGKLSTNTVPYRFVLRDFFVLRSLFIITSLNFSSRNITSHDVTVPSLE